jgi:hypothetical protein
VNVGRVTAVYWPGHETGALALAEVADRAGPWPGIPGLSPLPIRLILASNDHQFDSVAAGRAPSWSGGLAFPASNTIVLRLSTGDPRRALAHELAHLALHAVVPRVPRWFDEGYAGVASGEWDRLEALQLNWALAAGHAPTLDDLNADLASTAGRAQAAYALATSAVLFLQRLGGERGLAPFIAALHESPDFERALRVAYATNQAGLEDLWHRDLRRRYGWLTLVASLGLFWIAVAGGLAVATVWRRRRDRARRLALDEGWIVPPPEEENVAERPPSRDVPSA